jgi:signal transduction histidine kinase
LASLKQIWNKIKYIGVDDTVDVSDRKFITLHNTLSFTSSLIVIGYIPFLFRYLPESRIFLYIVLLQVPLNLCILLFNYSKHYLIAKVYSHMLVVVTFVTISLLAGKEMNMQLYLILPIMVAFFIYSDIHKRIMYSMILIALGSFIGVEIWFLNHNALLHLSSAFVGTMATVVNTGLIVFISGFSFYIYAIYSEAEKELQEKQEEIKKSQAKLVQAEKLAALGRLTADIAHEIRNPLTALGGYGRRLQNMTATPKEKEYADIIVFEAGRLEHILRDVLTYSREARFHFEWTTVNEVIKGCLSTYAAMCEDHSIKIEEDLRADVPILIDKEQVGQAVSNLISNAIDAMQDGGLLTVSTIEEKRNNITYIAVHISDTGPGIAEDKLPLIFEPFHTTKEIGHGTGLGLSISRKIMEQHGGFVKAENKKEGGVIASLYFPYQTEEDHTKTPCWEFLKCGKDADCTIKCPAYPNYGRVCWVVAGTFSDGKPECIFAQRNEDCGKCEFYKKVFEEKNVTNKI